MLIKPHIDRNKPWLDFSTLNLLMRCPRSYYWRVEKEIAEAEPSQAIINGKAYHEAKFIFHKRRLEGKSFDESVADALLAMKPIMAEIREPKPEYTLSVAVETMMSYFNEWRNEADETIQVEIGFAVDLINFFFVGKIDRYKYVPGLGKLIEEMKSTSIVGERWQQRGRPNLQIDGYFSGVYLLTGEIPWGATLDVIPVHKDASKRKRPFRILTVRNEKDVEDWMNNVQEWWITLQRYKNDGFYPQNTEMCVPLVGFSCGFSTLCSLFPNPHRMGEIEIPGEYKREPWAPYEALLENEEDEQN